MRNFISTLCLLILFSASAIAQQADSDDPFKRDPIFTKSIDELFGSREAEDEVERPDREELDKVVRRLSTTGLDLGGSLEAGPYYSNALYSNYPNLPMIHFNRVNGLFLGVRKERMQWHRYGNFLDIPQIQPHGFIGWGTASKRWEYAIGLEKLIGERNRLLIGAEYHNATSTEDYKRVGLTETSLTAFFAGYDFLDYHKMEGFGLYAVYRTSRWLETAFSYNRDTFSSVEQKTGYTMFGKSSTYRLNPPIDEYADEIDLDIYGFSVSLNPRRVLISDKFTVAGTVTLELADNSSSDEDYRYNKYLSEFQLFYNFEPGSVLRWKMQAGGITGNAPDFKNFYLGGIGTLRGSPYKFFGGNQMFASNLEVQFGRPSHRVGEWIRDYNLHLLLFLDSGWIRELPELRDAGSPFKNFGDISFSEFQHDAGIGLGTGAIRFELAWPLRTFDSTPTLWVRFNPTF
jgi:hypothetical protein